MEDVPCAQRTSGCDKKPLDAGLIGFAIHKLPSRVRLQRRGRWRQKLRHTDDSIKNIRLVRLPLTYWY